MLQEVTLSPEIWESARERRRIEFRVCLEGLRRASAFDPLLTRLELRLDESALHLRGLTAQGELLADICLPREALAPLTREYLEIIDQLGDSRRALGLSRMEALDMAKKAVHDRAGRLLLRRCRALGFDLDSARRLFSLWVALSSDTTRLGEPVTH
ncbi:MAG: hypothetical protein GXP55_13610 [Deltaproteobacteria bacterium]|nr:hypothetical protein [Deltaproteobacteria bacterium]